MNTEINQIVRFILLVLTLTIAHTATAKTSAPQLAPSDLHRETALNIVRQLEKVHYAGRPVNDELSRQLYDTAFDKLDPGRILFLQSDIARFADRATKLDDELLAGDLTTGFEIYNLFIKRYTYRLDWLLDNLPQLMQEFDFSKDETIQIDRSKAPRPASLSEATELWRQRLKNQVLSLRLTDKDNAKIEELLYKRLNNNLTRIMQNEPEDVFQFYMNALASLYDPHTDYFSPRLSENFQINMSLKLEGIGAVLESKDEYTRVVRLVPGGPASQQGQLQPADRIIAVAQGQNGEFEDVVGWRLDDVVDLIRGPKDTMVRLEVIPANSATDDKSSVVVITRNEVKLEEQSAKSKIIEVKRDDGVHKIGVIDVPTFYMDFDAWRRGDPEFKSTTRDVAKLLNELNAEGVEGIVIDLRDNGGGSLAEANNLTGLFINAGPTVQIRQAQGKVSRQGKRLRGHYYEGPLAVMINRLSASASEIFAAAIQDYQRGVIIGTQSFGKGTVQSISPLKHGQLKITESKFYRISGDSTQHRGVIPDIEYPPIYNTEKVGESSLDNALDWDSIKPIVRRKYFELDKILPKLRSKHDERTVTHPEFVFLREQRQQMEKLAAIEYLSLNEEVRRKQREEEKALLLDMENRRRAGQGIELLDELEEEDVENSDDKVIERARKALEEKDEPDPLIVEASEILVDSLPFHRNQLVARRR